MPTKVSFRCCFWFTVLNLVLLPLNLAADPLDHWTMRSAGTTNPLTHVVYGNEVFVAVEAQQGLLTSPDGRTWTRTLTSTNAGISGLAFGNGQFLAAGNDYTGVAIERVTFASLDGLNWIRQTVSPPLNWSGFTFGNSNFLAFSRSFVLCFIDPCPQPDRTVALSSDGLFWGTYPADTEPLSDFTIYAVTHGSSGFVAMGARTEPELGERMLVSGYSSDGRGWQFTPVDTLPTRPCRQMTFGKDLFVWADANRIWYLPVRGAWGSVDSGSPSDINGLAFGGGTFIAVGAAGKVATSVNATEWRSRTPVVPQRLLAAAFGKGTFVAVGEEGIILQSDPLIRLSPGHQPAELMVVAPPGRTCEFEYSDRTSLTNQWVSLGMLTVTNEPQIWVDSTATNLPQRFYRAVLQP